MKKVIFILFILPCFLLGQDKIIDSLKIELKKAKHDTTRCNILNELAETASDQDWPVFNEQLQKLAEKCALNSKNTTLKNFYSRHLATALNNRGVLANQKGDIPKALDFYYKSLKIMEESSLPGGEVDKKGIAATLNNIGVIYQNQGDIPKALEFYHKSLKIKEEIMDKKGVALSLNNIGFIYRNQGDISKALEFYYKSLKIKEEIADKRGIALSLNNIGNIYQDEGDPSCHASKEDCQKTSQAKALEFYHKSLKIREEIMDKEGIAASLNNIGNIYQDQGDPSCHSSKEDCLRAGQNKALEFYHKSLKINEEIMDKEGIAASLNNIGNILFNLGKITQAIVYTSRSMGIAKELGFPFNIKTTAALLKNIYRKQNKHKEAFEMYELEVKMRDSINNEETQKVAVKKQMQYEYEAKAKELQNEQEKKDIVAKEELKQREKERNYFVIGFALVIVLALFIFRSYRQKQKANVIISQQKHEVEESRKEILDSIHYAKRIQKAHLPTHNYIDKNLNRLLNKG